MNNEQAQISNSQLESIAENADSELVGSGIGCLGVLGTFIGLGYWISGTSYNDETQTWLGAALAVGGLVTMCAGMLYVAMNSDGNGHNGPIPGR